MYCFEFNNDLSIKELDGNKQEEVWLAEQLDKDQLLKKYLWSIREALEERKRSFDPYDTEYALYYKESPIGYFHFSHVKDTDCSEDCVYISYALIEEARKKGYMFRALESVSEQMLEYGIDKVILCVNPENTNSICTAIHAGFLNLEEDEDFLYYEKTQDMLKRDRCLH